ncbi:MAG: porin [Thiobacillus sp.]
MMKKILAVAIASAFAAPAFAATANVDVYGQINLSVDNVDNGAERRNTMSTNNNSFFGFKGSEDLGGGMKAVWQIEANLSIDGSSQNVTSTTVAQDRGVIFGSRNSYVGLSGGFGTVLGGVHDTPYKTATGPLDLFVGTLGDYNAVFGAAGGTGASNLFDLRTANTIAYVSPTFGGFDVKAAYVMGEGFQTSGAKSDAYSLSATYKNGPLFATGAYEAHKNTNTCPACTIGTTGLANGSASTLDQDAWKLGVGFTMGAFKVGAVYEDISGDATGTSAIDHSTWMLNGAYAMGAITLKASYSTADDLGSNTNTGSKMWAVGADYALSKRTTAQLTYARMNNDSAGKWGLGQGAAYTGAANGTAGAGGDDVSGFSLGLRHSF